MAEDGRRSHQERKMTMDTQWTDGHYQFRSFRAGTTESGADDETSAWLEATALSFHSPAPSAEHMARVAASFHSERRVLSGAYVSESLPGAWDANRPVATYAAFDKPLNVGNGNFLDAHLIADLTVRATHRRRGLMRALMSADLRRAAENGLAIAALRAMEATIYARSGFGPAILARHVEVDTGDRFALLHDPEGCVEVTAPSALLDVAPHVFDRFHAQTLGSIQRQRFYPSKIAGIWAEDRPLPDPDVRAALHYDTAGDIDGYVTYKFSARDSQPGTIEVVDMVATSTNAYLGLWGYLGSIDLVTLVRYRQAPATDALPWAMHDRRGFRVVDEEDAVWLRVLDPVAALESRSYDIDGEVRVALSDPLDLASGVYSLLVRDGKAAAARAGSSSRPADISMDISTFGSLFLGGVRARVLAHAGRISARSTAALDELDALMAHREAPYCITQF
jgi:predicted acetyltransferase